MSVNEIEEGIQELPEELKREVLDYIEFLLSKHESKNHGKKIQVRLGRRFVRYGRKLNFR